MSEYSEIAVLAASILMLMAIVAKLVISNLIARAKKNWTRLDQARREIIARLKKAQLARTSAQGTLEFWERRRQEASMKVVELERDVEAYAEQYGDDTSVDEDEALLESSGAERAEAGYSGDGEAISTEAADNTGADAEGDGEPVPTGDEVPMDGGLDAAPAVVTEAEERASDAVEPPTGVQSEIESSGGGEEDVQDENR